MMMGLMGHPNVVGLTELWIVDGFLATRWELAEMSLADVLARYQRQGEKGIPLGELLRYMADVASGIDFWNT